MKVGDYVGLYSSEDHSFCPVGVVIGFNKKGEGGTHFVHVMTDAGVEIFSAWSLHVIDPKESS